MSQIILSQLSLPDISIADRASFKEREPFTFLSNFELSDFVRLQTEIDELEVNLSSGEKIVQRLKTHLPNTHSET